MVLAVAPSQAEPPAPAVPPAAITSSATPPVPNGLGDAAAMVRFLDRLMLAESGGRDDARNSRSTALGPFQFIESTFLQVARRHLAAETIGLAPAQILAKRTDRAFSRRAAEAYTRDNAAALAAAGLETNFANLRLAFLAGAGGAIRVLKVEPKTPVIAALGAHVVQANPFMAGMTAADLAAWAGRNLAASDLAKTQLADGPEITINGPIVASAKSLRAKPTLAVHCKRGLSSCRRWVALATSRLQRGQVVARKSGRSLPR